MRLNYKKLGDFIELIERRNTNLEYGIDDVMGINNTKELMETKARSEYADLTKFYILEPGEFIYNPRTSRNGEKVGMAYNNTDHNILFTFNNIPFRIKNECKDLLDADYLYLYYLNPEFDRYARYNSWGSATELFPWDEMCRIELQLPSIDKQRRIVHDYKVITNRIKLLSNLCDNLEAEILAIYHKTFDTEGVCKEGIVAELGEVVGGATPSTDVAEYFCKDGITWLSPKDITTTNLKFISRGETDITEAGYKSCSTKMLPIGTVLLTSRAPVGTVAIATKELCTNQGFKSIVPHKDFMTEYIYCLMKDKKQYLEANASGTTFLEISGDTLKKLIVPIPDEKVAKSFSNICKPIFSQQMAYENEISILKDLASLCITSISSNIA